MMAYYAYSTIRYDGGVVNYGEKVDQKVIGVSDEEWQTFLDDNVVGEEPIPDDLKTTESLVSYNLRKAKEDYEAAQAGEIKKSTPATKKSALEPTASDE